MPPAFLFNIEWPSVSSAVRSLKDANVALYRRNVIYLDDSRAFPARLYLNIYLTFLFILSLPKSV